MIKKIKSKTRDKKEKTKVLLVNICKEKLHYYEFVKPIEDVLIKNNIDFFTKHYSKINSEDIRKASHIIICGTSLKDNEFAENVGKFKWIENLDKEKKLLGICGGMQVLGLLYGGKLKKKTEIGFFSEKAERDFLGIKEDFDEGEYKVYHLHNNYVDFSDLEEFEVLMRGSDSEKIVQAVKLKEKDVYGVLFHPEVRQKDLIINFTLL